MIFLFLLKVIYIIRLLKPPNVHLTTIEKPVGMTYIYLMLFPLISYIVRQYIHWIISNATPVVLAGPVLSILKFKAILN